MSEEVEVPSWIEEYLDRAFVDKEGVWTFSDLPEKAMDWNNIIFYMVCHALAGEGSIHSLADCELLVHHLLPKYPGKFTAAIQQVAFEVMSEYREIKKSPCSVCKVAVASDHFLNICAECKEKYAGEAQLVRIHLYRARRAGTSATLTLPQWLETLNRFNHRCAYCPDGNYEVLEHYIPITQGGGTTQENCVPSCQKCNTKKRNKHPEAVDAEA